MFIRREWIKETGFFVETNEQVLQKVIAGVDAAIGRKELPIVIFDLDSTLFDVSKRSFMILKEWMAHPEALNFTETLNQMSDLKPSDMHYSLEDVWEIKKIPYDKPPFDHHYKQARHFWKKRFFSNDYLVHDHPTDGAVEFVNRLYQMGAMIVYLTGRDVPLMAFGTYDQLKQHGLPIEMERTRLILKPKRHINDIDFKSGVAKTVKGWGKVIASFENEPKNLIAMANEFNSDTMNVFIESVSSDHPAPAGKEIYRIKEFRL